MDSVYEILKAVLNDPTVNYFRLPAYKAEAEVEAAVRVESGETKRSDGGSFFASQKVVGADRDVLFITLARDAASRQVHDDNSFGYRTRHIGSIEDGLKIESIFVNHRFISGFNEIHLTGLPLFPILQPENEKDWLDKMESIERLKVKRHQVKLDRDRLKKKMKKDVPVSHGSLRVYWKEPTGTTTAVFGSNDEKVSTSKQGFKKCVRLVFNSNLNIPAPVKRNDLQDLPELMKEYETLGKAIEELQTETRPYELGLIENAIGDMVVVAGVEFKIHRWEESLYDYPAEVKTGLKDGTFKVKSIPVSRGSWEWEEKSPVSENMGDSAKTVSA